MKGSLAVRFLPILAAVGGCAFPVLPGEILAADAPAAAPEFKEVYELIRTHAGSINADELDRAAVEGLLGQVRRHAWVEKAGEPDAISSTNSPISSVAVFDDHYAYVRVSRVEGNVAEAFKNALEGVTSTNKVRGVVVDLRYAEGRNYAAAAAVADGFLRSEQKLLEWSGGAASSREKSNHWRWPVTVLVNRSTAGSAEALAAVLRQTDVALLIGTNTAGQASTTRDFPLRNGQRLRIATSPVKLGNGDAVTSLRPDIVIEVAPDDEKSYFEDAYKVLTRPGMEESANVASLSVTNRPPRRRVINEAELVRMRREGEDPEEEARAVRPAVPARPVISDPALARAVDLLKALSVVRHTRF